jgi:hypothetical protein
MTLETLSLGAGAVLSLLASYIPGWDKWYSSLEPIYKRIIMAVLLVLVSAGIFGLSCMGMGDQIGVAVTCDYEGGAPLFRIFISALIANQAAYAISKKE